MRKKFTPKAKRIQFLLDANLSHETALFLRLLGYQAVTADDVKLGTADDEAILKFAINKHYIIITFDLDFANLFYLEYQNKVGVITLRLEDQTVESVNNQLQRFLNTRLLREVKNHRALIIIDEKTIRVRSASAKSKY